MDLETVKQALGAEIRAWRRRHKVSQEKFAEGSLLSANEIRRLERGRTNPELKTLVLIATGMGLSLGVLFTAAEKRWRETQGDGPER